MLRPLKLSVDERERRMFVDNTITFAEHNVVAGTETALLSGICTLKMRGGVWDRMFVVAGGR